jgi:hypothetical protein
MSRFNQNSGWGGSYFASIPFSSGKVIMLAASTDANYDFISQMWTPDADGTQRLYSTWATAIAACTTNRGDMILVSPGFTTAPTLAELALMHTGKITCRPAYGQLADGSFVTLRASATLPATTATPYFTVTGKIRLLDIIGEVTTVVQSQANAIKLIANPTVGADVDLCTTVESNAAAVGSIFTITGTLANAMVKTVSGAGVAQAAPLIIAAGSIDLSAAATNTGATKWLVRWIPIDPGALVIAA